MTSEMNMITNTHISSWLRAYAAHIASRADELNQLDGAQGDGDFGASMLRGTQGIVAKLDGVSDKDIGTQLKTVAMTLISSMGGTSGPLLGTLFLQMSTSIGARDSVDLAGWTQALDAGITGIMARGKAQLGDKTMLDALIPALDALKAASADTLPSALMKAAGAAQSGAEHTATITANKGRASYVGERSLGHIDPGALNIAILFGALAQTIDDYQLTIFTQPQTCVTNGQLAMVNRQ
jgi:phosphoenolpyruvate---glycerone phosphotransferase subunit DhaL